MFKITWVDWIINEEVLEKIKGRAQMLGHTLRYRGLIGVF